MRATLGMFFCLFISGISTGFGLIGLGLGKTPETPVASFIALILSLGGWVFVFAYNRKSHGKKVS